MTHGAGTCPRSSDADQRCRLHLLGAVSELASFVTAPNEGAPEDGAVSVLKMALF